MNDNRGTIDEGDLTTADIARPDPRPAETGGGKPTPEPAPEPEAQAEEPFFPRDGAEQLRSRWTEIQAGFVDEPRRSVEEADGLVAAAIKQIAETFANERSGLEAQWDRGDDVSTEDLRIALRRYRSFFDRILSM